MHNLHHQTQPDHEESKKPHAESTPQSESSITQDISQLRAGTPHQNQTIRRKAATRLSQQIGNQAFIRRMVAPAIQRDDAPSTATPSDSTQDATTDDGPKSFFSTAFASHIQAAYNWSVQLEAEAQEVSNGLEMYAAGANALAGQYIQGKGAPPEMRAEGTKARAGLNEHIPSASNGASTALDAAKATYYQDNPD